MTSDAWIKSIIVLVYFLAVAGIGYAGWKATKNNPRDYFLTSTGMGKFVIAGTTFASIVSAFAFFGVPGVAYATGPAIVLTIGLIDTLYPVLILVVGYKMLLIGKKYGFISPTEYYVHRFQNARIGHLHTAIGMLTMTIFVGTQLIGGGLMIEAVTGGALDQRTASVLVAAVIVAYVMVGGMRSVAWTDLMQGIVMLIGIAVVGVAWLLFTNGLAGLAERTAQSRPELLSFPGLGGSATFGFVISSMVVVLLNLFCWPYAVQRFWATRDIPSLKFTAVSVSFGMGFLLFIGIMIGLTARAVPAFANVAPADRLMAVVTLAITHPILGAIILSGALAAMMSTADTFLLTTSSLFTRDIYKKYLNPGASMGRETMVARLVVLGLAVIGMGLAWQPPAMLVQIGFFVFQIMALMAIPLLAGLYWRRATGPGVAWGTTAAVLVLAAYMSGGFFLLAATCLLAGWFFQQQKRAEGGMRLGFQVVGAVVVVALLVLAYDWLSKMTPAAPLPLIPAAYSFTMLPGVIAYAVQIVVMVVVSLLTKAPDESHVREYVDFVEWATTPEKRAAGLRAPQPALGGD